MYGHSQWETTWQFNTVSLWLSAYPERSCNESCDCPCASEATLNLYSDTTWASQCRRFKSLFVLITKETPKLPLLAQLCEKRFHAMTLSNDFGKCTLKVHPPYNRLSPVISTEMTKVCRKWKGPIEGKRPGACKQLWWSYRSNGLISVEIRTA